MQEFLEIHEFCYKYEISYNSIKSTICQYPDSPLAKSRVKINKRFYIKEEYLIKRFEFRKKIWLESHSLYYAVNERINDHKFAIMLSENLYGTKQDWLQFLRDRLFHTANVNKITNPTINKKLWDFYRFTRSLIRIADRRYDARTKRRIRRSIEK